MLDSNIIEQLKSVYSALENEIVLQIYKSEHEKNIELKEMLESIATTSDKIKLEEIEESFKAPKFRILYQGKPNGVSFVGVPGGHEFTSLILAILNSDHKGKLPDDGIIKRIKNIKGP
ncbi:MAG: alkyl hydroperoxide reductase subunit F, partial [Halobacteriovoraceae bacterium]|nr:alkyl hydroperoxide reductase subunit F [Halobacteriovoraceae bacterium]